MANNGKGTRTNIGYLLGRVRVQLILAFLLLLFSIGLLVVSSMSKAVRRAEGPATFLVGAAFTFLVSVLVNERATTEQYRKEANLRRKSEVYGPLHDELRRVREYFERVASGAVPFPQWVDTGRAEDRPSLLIAAYEVPQLHLWCDFRENYRVQDFTDDATRELDTVIEMARTYNQAVAATRVGARSALSAPVEQLYMGLQQESIPDPQEWADLFARAQERSKHFAPAWIDAYGVNTHPPNSRLAYCPQQP